MRVWRLNYRGSDLPTCLGFPSKISRASRSAIFFTPAQAQRLTTMATVTGYSFSPHSLKRFYSVISIKEMGGFFCPNCQSTVPDQRAEGRPGVNGESGHTIANTCQGHKPKSGRRKKCHSGTMTIRRELPLEPGRQNPESTAKKHIRIGLGAPSLYLPLPLKRRFLAKK